MDLLEALAWTNDDNGHHLEVVRRRWLREGDLGRTELAFAMYGTYPGHTREELLANVLAGAARFPQFHERAQKIIEQWDCQHPAEPTGPAGSFRALQWEPALPMSTGEAAEFIADHPAPNAPPKFLSEIIDELLPCLTPDAQAELHAECEAWAVGDDEWRASVAAWMDVPPPGQTKADLLHRRAKVIARFPCAAEVNRLQ